MQHQHDALGGQWVQPHRPASGREQLDVREPSLGSAANGRGVPHDLVGQRGGALGEEAVNVAHILGARLPSPGNIRPVGELHDSVALVRVPDVETAGEECKWESACSVGTIFMIRSQEAGGWSVLTADGVLQRRFPSERVHLQIE